MPTVATIAQKRKSMFAQLGNDAVWDKNDPLTLIYALLDAIAKEHGNFQDAVDGVHDDLRLSTINRPDNLQARWGDMLQESVRGDITVAQNITIWRNMLHRIIYGVDILGRRFMPTTKNNIRQLVIDYSLVSECKIFELWLYASSFAGASVVNNALVWNSATHSWNEGLHSVWIDIDTLKGIGYLPTGFQIFPEITGYTRDTAIIEYAAQMMKPYHNIVGFCWMLTQPTEPVGWDANLAYLQVGTGSGAGPGCVAPVATVPVYVDSLDPNKHVVSYSTNLKRAIGIVRSADLPGAAEITEVCLLDATNTPIAGTYQTISAIHKKAGKPLAVGYYIQEM